LLATNSNGIFDDDKATSIRVLIDASVPDGASFTVWYRTGLQSEESENPLNEKSWTAFSKVSPNSNYDDFSVNQNRDRYAEYKFNKYDLTDFDAYQIKITMHSTNSAAVPTFRNLRTIATI